MKMLDRWNQIREIVNAGSYVTVDELVEKIGASPATIRRDLTAMERDGVIERFRGGAKPVQSSPEFAFSIDKRLMEGKNAKIDICKKAAEFVEDGEYIYIDTSSTTYYLPDFLQKKNVTVVTNSVMLLEKLLKNHIHTYVLSGTIEFESGSIVGEEANTKLRAMNFNRVFIGAYGVDLDRGYTTYNTGEGELKQRLLAQTKHTYVLADHTKFSKSSFFTFGGLESATIITDACPEEFRHKTNIIVTG